MTHLNSCAMRGGVILIWVGEGVITATILCGTEAEAEAGGVFRLVYFIVFPIDIGIGIIGVVIKDDLGMGLSSVTSPTCAGYGIVSGAPLVAI